MPDLRPGPSWRPVAPMWTLHVDCPSPASGLRLSTEATNCCQQAVRLTRGEVVDDFLAAWLRGHGYGGVLEELAGVCRIDGETGCEVAARIRVAAAQADWRGRLHVELEANGNVTRSLDQHTIVALNDAGRDWREVATVKVPGY